MRVSADRHVVGAPFTEMGKPGRRRVTATSCRLPRLERAMGATAVAFDVTYTDVTAVPEPARIALLLAGLGLVGVSARRRKQAPVA